MPPCSLCPRDNTSFPRLPHCIPRLVPFGLTVRAHNSRYTEHDLSSLFGDVLDIALADQLPVLNEAKTYSLSLWALGCHRLPLGVLGCRRDDVCSAIQRSLDGARQPGNTVLDGLKVGLCTLLFLPSHIVLGYFAYNRSRSLGIS